MADLWRLTRGGGESQGDGSRWEAARDNRGGRQRAMSEGNSDNANGRLESAVEALWREEGGGKRRVA